MHPITSYIQERIALHEELNKKPEFELQTKAVISELQAVLSKIEELGTK